MIYVKSLKLNSMKIFQRLFHSKNLRNVSVIAHIDAGKTTTSEGLLHASGNKAEFGSVDKGSTTTDYLPEEQARGITIRSSTVPITFNDTCINLIDTPGHMDFSNEVDKSLIVSDSCLVIIDSTRGIETQTKTVWKKADELKLPKMVYFNKMDRLDRLKIESMESVEHFNQNKDSILVNLQTPIFSKSTFVGIFDLISGTIHTGKNEFKLINPTEERENLIKVDLVRSEREKLVENLSLVDPILESQLSEVEKDPFSPHSIDCLKRSLRRSTINQSVIPMLFGSSSKQIGLLPILNSIRDFLPYPNEMERPGDGFIPKIDLWLKEALPSRQVPFLFIFKVQYDPFHGALALVRLHGGNLKGTKRKFMNLTKTRESKELVFEKSKKVYKLSGNQLEEIIEANEGDILAISCGQTSNINSGDILLCVESQEDISKLSNNLEQIKDLGEILRPPKPVVYAALTPYSQGDVKALDDALKWIMREDESFQARFSKENHGWLVGGLGDLHLEILTTKLLREHKLKVHLGQVKVAYKEIPIIHKQVNLIHVDSCRVKEADKVFGVAIRMGNINKDFLSPQTNQITFKENWLGKKMDYNAPIISHFKRSIITDLENYLEQAGRIKRNAICNIQVRIDRLQLLHNEDDVKLFHAKTDDVDPNESEAINVIRKVDGSMRKLIKDSLVKMLNQIESWSVLEPVMKIEIKIPSEDGEKDLGSYLNELSRRNADIVSIEKGHNEHVIIAEACLTDLTGFSSAIGRISRGTSTLALNQNIAMDLFLPDWIF